jgi:hypothetical protein
MLDPKVMFCNSIFTFYKMIFCIINKQIIQNYYLKIKFIALFYDTSKIEYHVLSY